MFLIPSQPVLAEKQHIPTLLSLVWPDRGSNPRSTGFETNTLIITQLDSSRIQISPSTYWNSSIYSRWFFFSNLICIFATTRDSLILSYVISWEIYYTPFNVLNVLSHEWHIFNLIQKDKIILKSLMYILCRNWHGNMNRGLEPSCNSRKKYYVQFLFYIIAFTKSGFIS